MANGVKNSGYLGHKETIHSELPKTRPDSNYKIFSQPGRSVK